MNKLAFSCVPKGIRLSLAVKHRVGLNNAWVRNVESQCDLQGAPPDADRALKSPERLWGSQPSRGASGSRLTRVPLVLSIEERLGRGPQTNEFHFNLGKRVMRVSTRGIGATH